MKQQLVCQICSKAYSAKEASYVCGCGGVLDLTFEGGFDVDRLAGRKPTLWRYREMLPIDDDANIVSFDEGFTPLVEVDFSGRGVLFKLEQLFTTGSFKDRGAAVLISKIKELGIASVVEDSSGNAGCAVAAYCAKAGIDCTIFAPASTSAGKLAQIQFYGARLNLVPGSREDTTRAVLKAAENTYYASHFYNPYFFHGTKTFAYEIAEQLNCRAPDTIITPVGHGSLLLGAALGFSELLQAGIIDKIPKFIGVQTTACCPLHQGFEQNLDEAPAIVKQGTIAEGIAIAEPLRSRQILQTIRSSGGYTIIVSEDEIKTALVDMARQGLYIEPTSAVAPAAVVKYLKTAPSDEIIVSVFTGHGLKAGDKILKFVGI